MKVLTVTKPPSIITAYNLSTSHSRFKRTRKAWKALLASAQNRATKSTPARTRLASPAHSATRCWERTSARSSASGIHAKSSRINADGWCTSPTSLSNPVGQSRSSMLSMTRCALGDVHSPIRRLRCYFYFVVRIFPYFSIPCTSHCFHWYFLSRYHSVRLKNFVVFGSQFHVVHR